MKILLADKMDITRAGLMYILGLMEDVEYKYTEDKTELLLALSKCSDSVVILDYTLFDMNGADELLIFNERFPATRWLLFSEDLSLDFVRRLVASSPQFSILIKDSSVHEIREAIVYAIQNKRFICQRMTEMLFAPFHTSEEHVNLTKTEVEILKDIALGMTTREIADKRFSSFHTVNTHRKNIFRKLSVNNVHEATKYALRAGLVDSAEYYI